VSPAVLVPAVAFLSAAVVLVVIMYGRRLPLPSATNYRGARVPVILGAAVTAGIVVGGLAALVSDLDKGRTLPTIRGTLQILVATTMVFVAGLFDDAQPARVRGLRAHGLALVRGRVTSGVVKLVTFIVAAMILVEATRGLSVEGVVGILFIAGATNLWNLLDVAPGRSMKFFILAALALQGAIAAASLDAPGGFSVFVFTGLAAALVALPFDLREHAMLGDGGANVLGFLVGAGLYLRLPIAWQWVALAVVVVLTVLAETVTLTRIMRAVPPLRWFDDWGRRRETVDAPPAPVSVPGD
jgi:UDP-GlcNAc:undecaprenyl-phosphate GlcNAc-1-phosphate transferase